VAEGGDDCRRWQRQKARSVRVRGGDRESGIRARQVNYFGIFGGHRWADKDKGIFSTVRGGSVKIRDSFDGQR
jgi:hypothetical protein